MPIDEETRKKMNEAGCPMAGAQPANQSKSASMADMWENDP